VEDKLKQLLSFVEDDANAWLDVAKSCEEFASGFPDAKKAEVEVLCAVYRERAKLHREMVAKFRQTEA
jgi:hypothetical protein